MRGAVAFALALSVPSPQQKIIVTTTLLIILFTIFCLGVGTKPLLKCLKLELKDIAITRHGESIHRSKSQISQFATQAPAGGVSSPGPSKRSFFEWVMEFDKEYLSRYLIRADDSERLE
jgi:sodium/hydrogen exchanger 8